TGFSFRNPGDDGMFFDRITTDREARGLQDFVWIPRFENSFNLSDTQTVLAGVSGAFGSNETGANSRTQIYGADLLYKWKSSHAEGGFPFVKWQTEFMYRRFQAGHGADDSFPVGTASRVDLSPVGIHSRRSRCPQILTHEKNSLTPACNSNVLFLGTCKNQRRRDFA